MPLCDHEWTSCPTPDHSDAQAAGGAGSGEVYVDPSWLVAVTAEGLRGEMLGKPRASGPAAGQELG